MRSLVFVFFLTALDVRAGIVKDIQGTGPIVFSSTPGEFLRFDHEVMAASLAPRSSSFNWSKLSGRWRLQEATESEVKFDADLDFFYFAGCRGAIGVAEHDGVAMGLSAWTFESKRGPYMYLFFPIGSKRGILLIEIGENDAITAKLTIVSQGMEYPMPVTFTRQGGTALIAHDAKVTSVAPPIELKDDVYFIERPMLTGGIVFHPKFSTAHTCMTDGLMGFTNPLFPTQIVTVSVGQKSGNYLLTISKTEAHERERGKTILSAITKDGKFWQRFFR